MDFEVTFLTEKGHFIIKTTGETSPDDVEKSLKQVFDSRLVSAPEALISCKR